MKILISTSIKEPYNNQFELSVDHKLIVFFKTIFKSAHIEIYHSQKNIKNFNLLVLSGGNDIFRKSIKDKLRLKIDRFLIQNALKFKIPVIGICHGAQFLAEYFEGTISKSKKHVGDHIVINLSSNKKTKVNSFHSNIINNLNKDFKVTTIANDNSIESFVSKKLKILGMQWHPERDKKFKKSDFKLVKNFYDFNNTRGRKRY